VSSPAVGFDPGEFRRAAGCYATGVTIVAARDRQGGLVGVTANSFTSVSLNPPLVSVALARALGSAAVFEAARHFSINVLHECQEDLARRFATRQVDKWRDVATVEGSNGLPLLEGTVAAFECERYALYDGGDHWILIGRVLGRPASPGGRPLVFHGGCFTQLAHAVAGDGI
jgi:flavin reductase (DIM6/NTAB) family NADH-FMN oxidoreductase RutF